jgi:flavin-dependent dehydrogenase
MKVTVIGASVSGLFAAYLLAKEGVEVEVYEKKKELGWPPRTLITTSKIAEVLDFVPEEAIINRVRYIELFSRSRSARLELSSPDLVVERGKLLNLLARLAEGAGAEIVVRHQFEGFAQFGRKYVVSLRNLETDEQHRRSTDILIGADGALSDVSRTASRDGHLPVSLIQAKTRFRQGVNKETTQVWFDSNLTRYFIWLIPESEQMAVAGLIADGREKAEEALDRFLQKKELEPLEVQAASVPMHRFDFFGNDVVSGDNIFFVGDAGAQVKVTTVGGIVTGLHGARALANALVNGRNYRKELRGLKRELDLHLLIRYVLNRFNEKDYDELIAMLDNGLKDILEESTRDELSKSFMSLILEQPRLITLGAKAFLRSMLQNSS